MQRVEKYLLIYLVIEILSRSVAFYWDISFATALSAEELEITNTAEQYLYRNALGHLPHLMTGVWLFLESHKPVGRKIMWTLLGIFSGIIGVGTFYAIQAWQQNKKSV